MNKIKAARKKAKLTQWQLAINIGVTTNYISALERGVKEASLALLTKISKVLEVNRGDLID